MIKKSEALRRAVHGIMGGAATSLLVAAVHGCGSDGTTNTATSASSSSTTGTGGAGGAGSTSSSSSGTGGGGGGGVTCLEASKYSTLFTIEDPDFCAIAVYGANVAGLAATWGRHGGPLTFGMGAAVGSVQISRWKPPSGSSGDLTVVNTEVPANIAQGTFLSQYAVDLPFFNWTAAAWSGAFPNTAGEVLLIDGMMVPKRYAVNSYFVGAGASDMTNQGRLLYSGLSALEDAGTSKSGLYAADSCGSPGQNPRLLPEGDPTCKGPIAVATWGDASGPVAIDLKGNVVAIMTSFSGPQEARGFEASTIGRGAGPTAGDVLFTLPGFGSSLAAVTPNASNVGVIAFQPYDDKTFDALDVIEQRYHIAGKSVVADGKTAPLLKLATPKTSLSLMVDDQDHLWVSGPGTGMTTTFVVLARVK